VRGPSGSSAKPVVGPNPGHRLWPLTLVKRLAGGPQGRFWVTWCSPTSVACSGGSFDPWEAERHILIGWGSVALD
jgi:hypothetical protein